jgi:hypothetical protein
MKKEKNQQKKEFTEVVKERERMLGGSDMR